MHEETKKRVIAFMESKGLRVTGPRLAIVEAAFGTTKHFTAEELLDMAKERDKSASRATIYRTLPILVESGLIREMDFGKNCKYYDPNYAEHPNHNHIICQDCDKIFEFDEEKIEEIEEEVSKKMGFKLQGQNLQLRGSCEKLKSLGACTHKVE